MRIMLKFDLDCTVDEAWDALLSPRDLGRLYSPVMSVISLEPGGFPARWSEGNHRVAVRALGILPMGTQTIGMRLPQRTDGVRMLRDVGPTTGGMLGLITSWEHTMAVSALPDGRTRYRDRLRFSAGALTPLLWPVLWAVWQWRGGRMQRMLSAAS